MLFRSEICRNSFAVNVVEGLSEQCGPDTLTLNLRVGNQQEQVPMRFLNVLTRHGVEVPLPVDEGAWPSIESAQRSRCARKLVVERLRVAVGGDPARHAHDVVIGGSYGGDSTISTEVTQIGTKEYGEPPITEKCRWAQVAKERIGVKRSSSHSRTLVYERCRGWAVVDSEVRSEHAVRLRRGTMESWV